MGCVILDIRHIYCEVDNAVNWITTYIADYSRKILVWTEVGGGGAYSIPRVGGCDSIPGGFFFFSNSLSCTHIICMSILSYQKIIVITTCKAYKKKL